MPEGLREKLERWKRWPAFNEEATIRGLVLPILAKAGYDPFNPEEVFPQGRDENKLKPDLLLYRTSPMEGGNPHMAIEVKALGKKLSDHHNQVVQYMNGLPSARWYVLTDGETWEFFDRDRPLPLENSLRFRVALSEPGGEEALTRLLGKAYPDPPFEEAERLMADALLEYSASRATMEEHRTAYRISGEISKDLRRALRDLRERFPALSAYLDEWERAWCRRLEGEAPPPASPQPLVYESWRKALHALGLLAHRKDPQRAEEVLKLLPSSYQGPLSALPFSDGKLLCVNYSKADMQKLLRRLAERFPELKGKAIEVKGERFTL